MLVLIECLNDILQLQNLPLAPERKKMQEWGSDNVLFLKEKSEKSTVCTAKNLYLLLNLSEG